jgi:hypothetical protein
VTDAMRDLCCPVLRVRCWTVHDRGSAPLASPAASKPWSCSTHRPPSLPVLTTPTLTFSSFRLLALARRHDRRSPNALVRLPGRRRAALPRRHRTGSRPHPVRLRPYHLACAQAPGSRLLTRSLCSPSPDATASEHIHLTPLQTSSTLNARATAALGGLTAPDGRKVRLELALKMESLQVRPLALAHLLLLLAWRAQELPASHIADSQTSFVPFRSASEVHRFSPSFAVRLRCTRPCIDIVRVRRPPAFKIRGGLNASLRYLADSAPEGPLTIITHSSGNHAQAVRPLAVSGVLIRVD